MTYWATSSKTFLHSMYIINQHGQYLSKVFIAQEYHIEHFQYTRSMHVINNYGTILNHNFDIIQIYLNYTLLKILNYIITKTWGYEGKKIGKK